MKCMLFLMFAILFFPSRAMDEEEIQVRNTDVVINIPKDPTVGEILDVSDPIKFAALTRQLANRPVSIIVRAKNMQEKPLTKKQELQLMQESMDQISQLNIGIVADLNYVNQKALQPCNTERKKGLGWTIAWALGTGALLAVGGYVLFGDFSVETKIATDVTVVTTALGTALKFLDNARKTITNEHINEKLEAQLKKAEIVQSTKENLARSIERLKIQIEKERKERVGAKKKQKSS